MSRLAFVIKQAGTANALLPLIENLSGEEELQVLAYDKAFSICSKKLSSKRIENAIEAITFLNSETKLCITGTSLQSKDDEILWKNLKAKNIRSIAYVEQWCNLEERFEKIVSFPDFVWVVDQTASERLQKIYPALAGKISVVGSPALFHKYQFTKEDIQLREKIAFYISQPMREDDGVNSFNGYSQFKNFLILQRELPLDWKLKIFLHPIDQKKKWENYVDTRTEIIENGSKLNLFQEARLVIGLTSVLLAECAEAGLPVISVQVGKLNDNDSYGIDNNTKILKLINENEISSKKLTSYENKSSVDKMMKQNPVEIMKKFLEKNL